MSLFENVFFKKKDAPSSRSGGTRRADEVGDGDVQLRRKRKPEAPAQQLQQQQQRQDAKRVPPRAPPTGKTRVAPLVKQDAKSLAKSTPALNRIEEAATRRRTPRRAVVSIDLLGKRQKEHGSSSGGAGEDLSRASSISNLNAADSNNKVGGRGALAKARKSISKDRLDVSGVKPDKKGGNKNNNQPEQHVAADADELIALRQQLDAMAGEKSNLMLQLGDQRGQLTSLQKEIARLKSQMFQEQSSVQLEQLNDENSALRNKLRDVVHSPLSDNEKQMLLLDSAHRHHSSAPASIAANLLSDSGGGGGDVTTCSTPDWDKQSSSNVSEVSVACLQDRINQMQETHYSTNEELQATLQELTDLQRQLTELQQDNEHLLEEKNLMFDSLCRQTERLNDARSEIESLKQLLYRDKDESGQYEGVVEREQKLVDLLKGAQEERELLLLKQEQLTNELQEVRALHSQRESDNAQLTERVRTLESTLDAKHAEHRQLDQDLARAKDKASSRQIEIDRLTDLLENARTKIAELEQDRALSDKSELDELLDNARKEKDALESEVAHLKEQVARGRNEGEKLREQVSILQEECKVLRNNAKCTQSELEYKVEKLNGEKAGLLEQLQRFEEAANELQVQVQCHLEDKRQLSSVLSETQRNMSEVERHSQDLEVEVKELKKLRSEENEEWEKFQNDLLTSVRVANDFKTEAQQELQKLVMENKAHRDKIRQLEGQVEKLKERVDSALELLSSAMAGVASAPDSEVSVSTARKAEDSVSLPLDLDSNVSSVDSLARKQSPKEQGSVTSAAGVPPKRVSSGRPLDTAAKQNSKEQEYVTSAANLGSSDLASVSSVDGLAWKQGYVTSPADVGVSQNLKDETASSVSSASSLDSGRPRAGSVTSAPQDAKEMYYLDYINEQYSKIDLATPFAQLTPEEQFILKLKQGYDRHLAQPRAKPLQHKHGIAISKPLLSSIYANPTLKTIYDSSEYLNVEALNEKSKSTGDLSDDRSEVKKDFVRKHLEHRVSEMSEYQDSVLIDDEDNLSYSEPNLVELYGKIDKTKPEHLLSKEERYVVRLKASLDKLGRKATLKKRRLNKGKVGISSPVIESVLSNENLAQIVRDPNIGSVKGEDNVDLRYEDSAYVLNRQLRIEDSRISTDSDVYSYNVATGEVKQTFSTFGKSKSIDAIRFNFKGTPATSMSGEVNYATVGDDRSSTTSEIAAGEATNFHLVPRPREPPDLIREESLYAVVDEGMLPKGFRDEARYTISAPKNADFVTSAQHKATSSVRSSAPELYAVVTKSKSKPRMAVSAEKLGFVSSAQSEATLTARSSAPDIYAVVTKGNSKLEHSVALGFVASAQNEATLTASAPELYAVVTKGNPKATLRMAENTGFVPLSQSEDTPRLSVPDRCAVVTKTKENADKLGFVSSTQIEATSSPRSGAPVTKGTNEETKVTETKQAQKLHNYQRISPNFVKFPSFFEKPRLVSEVKPTLDDVRNEVIVSSVRTTQPVDSASSLAAPNCRRLATEDITAAPLVENNLSSPNCSKYNRLPEDKMLLMRNDTFEDVQPLDSNVSSVHIVSSHLQSTHPPSQVPANGTNHEVSVRSSPSLSTKSTSTFPLPSPPAFEHETYIFPPSNDYSETSASKSEYDSTLPLPIEAPKQKFDKSSSTYSPAFEDNDAETLDVISIPAFPRTVQIDPPENLSSQLTNPCLEAPTNEEERSLNEAEQQKCAQAPVSSLHVPTTEDESKSSRKASTSSSNQSSESLATIVPRAFAADLTDEEVELIRRIRVSCSSPLSDLDCEDRSLIEYARGALDEGDIEGSKIEGSCEHKSGEECVFEDESSSIEDRDKSCSLNGFEDVTGEDPLREDLEKYEFEDLDLKEESRIAKPVDGQFNIAFNFEDGRKNVEDLQVLGLQPKSSHGKRGVEFIGFEDHTKENKDSEVEDRERVSLHRFEDHVDKAQIDAEGHVDGSEDSKRSSIFEGPKVRFEDHPDWKVQEMQAQNNSGDQEHRFVDGSEVRFEEYEDQTGNQHIVVDRSEDLKQSAKSAGHRRTNEEQTAFVDPVVDDDHAYLREYLAATKECDLEEDYSPEALSSFIFNYRRVVGSLKKKIRLSCEQWDENNGTGANEVGINLDEAVYKSDDSERTEMKSSEEAMECGENRDGIGEDCFEKAAPLNGTRFKRREDQVAIPGNASGGFEVENVGEDEDQAAKSKKIKNDRVADLENESEIVEREAHHFKRTKKKFSVDAVECSENEDGMEFGGGDAIEKHVESGKIAIKGLKRNALDEDETNGANFKSQAGCGEDLDEQLSKAVVLQCNEDPGTLLECDDLGMKATGGNQAQHFLNQEEMSVFEDAVIGFGSKAGGLAPLEDHMGSNQTQHFPNEEARIKRSTLKDLGIGSGSEAALEDQVAPKERRLGEYEDQLMSSQSDEGSLNASQDQLLRKALGSGKRVRNQGGKSKNDGCTVGQATRGKMTAGGLKEEVLKRELLKVVDAATEFEDQALTDALGSGEQFRNQGGKSKNDECTVGQATRRKITAGGLKEEVLKRELLKVVDAETEFEDQALTDALGSGEQFGREGGRSLMDQSRGTLLEDNCGRVEGSKEEFLKHEMLKIVDGSTEFEGKALADALGSGKQLGSDGRIKDECTVDQVTLLGDTGGHVEGSMEEVLRHDASTEFEDLNDALVRGKQFGSDGGKRVKNEWLVDQVTVLGNKGRREDDGVLGCNAGEFEQVDKTLEYREDEVDALEVGKDEAACLDSKANVHEARNRSSEEAKVGVAPRRPVPRPRSLQSSKLTVKGSRSVSRPMDEPGNSESFPSSGTMACSNSEGEKLCSGAVPKAVKSSSFETGGAMDNVASAASAVTADMSMENLYESNSSSDDFQLEASYGDLFKRPEDKIFESLTPVREKRELFTVTVKTQQPKPADEVRVASSEKVALLKRRFEEAGRPKPEEEAGLDVGHAFHDINRPTPRPLAPLKLDVSQSEIKLQEENLDVDSKTSIASAAREGELPRRKSHIETGTSRESFELAKKMFERGAK